jgi:hypothetical protein
MSRRDCRVQCLMSAEEAQILRDLSLIRGESVSELVRAGAMSRASQLARLVQPTSDAAIRLIAATRKGDTP